MTSLPSPAPVTQPAEHRDLLEPLRILRKRWLPFLVVLVLVTGGAAAYTLRQVPQYRAVASVLIERSTPRLGNSEDVFAIWAFNTDYYQTQAKILEGPALATRVIATLGLEKRPDFAPPDSDSKFRGRLEVTATRNTRIIEIAFLHPDPALAASIVNTLVKEYSEDSIERRVSGIRAFHAQLTEQAAGLRLKLEESEKALLTYNRLHGLVSGDEKRNTAQQRLDEAATALSRADEDRRQAEAQMEMVKAAGSDLRSLKPVQASGLIRDLTLEQSRLQQQRAEILKTHKPAHPNVEAINSKIDESEKRIQAEIETIVAGIRHAFDEATARVSKAKDDLAKRKEEKAQLDNVLADAEVLRRERDANQTMYDSLIKQVKEADITGGIEITQVKLLAPAKPPSSPAKPNVPMNIAMGLFAGLCLGASLIYLLERLDSTVRTPEDVEQLLGLPILSVVPEVRSNGVEIVPATVLWKEEKSQAAEAFRGLRTTVLLSLREANGHPGATEVKRVVLTSSGPDEGKTVSACNLAISLAQAGYRTLLIDADFHRPQHHKIFGVSREKGLSTVIASDGDPNLSVLHSSVPNLDLLVSGPTPPQPAALLGSPRFKAVLDQLSMQYDRVIIDTPPVGAVSDACVVAPHGDGLLLVVQPGLTLKASAKRTVQTLLRMGVKPLGAIMNRIKQDEGGYYYKYYQYYNKYSGNGSGHN